MNNSTSSLRPHGRGGTEKLLLLCVVFTLFDFSFPTSQFFHILFCAMKPLYRTRVKKEKRKKKRNKN
jgi:hypothetical protein